MDKKIKKYLDAIYKPSIRELLETANSLGINKDDIVSILDKDGQFFLIFERALEVNNPKE